LGGGLLIRDNQAVKLRDINADLPIIVAARVAVA
jgi:hypothetical protein